MEILLTVVEGPHKGREFSFSGHDTFLVGRSKRTHFQLIAKDKYFSRIHFLVEVNPPRCRIVDMNSHNGTYVNDRRVKSAELRHGDRIKAGHTVLQVTVKAEVEDEPVSAVSRPRGEDTLSWEDVVDAVEQKDAPAEEGTSPLPQIPGYHIIRELGRGGMGVVYLARDERGGGKVALKTITPAVAPSRAAVARFLREAKILKQLQHPRIVSFHDMGEAGGLLYFAMEYVPGSDGARLVKQHGRLPVSMAVTMVCQLLEALEHAHEQGFVHRDIKPANLLVTETDKGKQAKLADFGLARVYQTSQLSGLTLSGEYGGTLQFMAPEQITQYRQVKPPGDQYSAAATLYYLLTGKFIYDFAESGTMPLLLILQNAPVPIEKRGVKLPDGLARVIHKALAREPQERFGDAGALRRALLSFAE